MSQAVQKVLVLTGKRGGYGAMKRMLRLLRDDSAFDLQLVVTDQHVRAQFGHTVDEVRQEFDVAAAVDMEQEDDSPEGRARAVGRCTMRMVDTLRELSPDICVLYGDRGEVLATATAATLMGIPIAHLQGGDVSGSLDEQMRHAVTKLAHIHFPSTEESASRIRRMGEEAWRVHVVGDNHIDSILAGEYANPEVIAETLNLDMGSPIAVVLQHSETTAPQNSYDQMVETMEAVRDVGCQAVVVHPCSDQGYEGVIRAIDELGTTPQFRIRVNLDAPLFLGLLRVATVMIGNSSAGLIETPYFGIPAINIGRRQEGRLHAENVIHVAHDRSAISAALSKVIADPSLAGKMANCSRPFGDGNTGDRIVDVLRELEINDDLLIKRFED